ncbi:MAG: tRNA (guanosine(46)-N7)-methyltransferase TrmB [Alphaproteobacteria bacterium]|nr:MAG: tRNA (guanosine(46)-N7)-methyltransferase TrmB [Alphaproteobacteria bacterium]
MSRDQQPQQRTFGRRKGHRLSPRKQALLDHLLPRLRIDLTRPAPEPLGALFEGACAPDAPVALEIGFGAGEHLLWQAQAQPDWGFIGCEVYVNGVTALLSGIEAAGVNNIRIHDEDARALLGWLPDACLERVFILFPDPWPKKRHAKRRLVNEALLGELARVMRPGAELRIASDIGDYVRTTLLALQKVPAFEWLAAAASDWRQRPADWPQTRYERKALREGRKPVYLRLRRR